MDVQNLPALPDASHLAGPRRHSLNEASITGLGFPQPPRISRLGGRFYFVGENGDYVPAASFDPQLGSYVDVVVVDVNEKRSKIYFDKSKPYDPNREDPPLCFSDNGIAPSVNAIQPQSQLCANCPQNVKGSAISGLTGAEVWACKDNKKLAVLASGQAGTWLFTIPAASLSKYRDYVSWVAKQQLPGANRAADIADMVTRIYFEPGKPNILEFRAVGVISREIAAMQDRLLESKQTDSVVGRTDQPRQPALPVSREAPTAVLTAPQATALPPPPPNEPASPATGFAIPPGPAVQTINGGQQQPRRTRRSKAEMEATRQQPQQPPAQAQAKDPLAIPAFLDRNQNPAAPPPPQPAQPVNPQPQFGIAQLAAPSADIAAAVADAFKLV